MGIVNVLLLAGGTTVQKWTDHGQQEPTGRLPLQMNMVPKKNVLPKSRLCIILQMMVGSLNSLNAVWPIHPRKCGNIPRPVFFCRSMSPLAGTDRSCIPSGVDPVSLLFSLPRASEPRWGWQTDTGLVAGLDLGSLSDDRPATVLTFQLATLT